MIKKIVIPLFAATVIFSNCSKDDDLLIIDNEKEDQGITTDSYLSSSRLKSSGEDPCDTEEPFGGEELTSINTYWESSSGGPERIEIVKYKGYEIKLWRGETSLIDGKHKVYYSVDDNLGTYKTLYCQAGEIYSDFTPTTAVSPNGNYLYIIWDTHRTDDYIWIQRYKSVKPNGELELDGDHAHLGGRKTKECPSATTFNGNIYVFYRKHNGERLENVRITQPDASSLSTVYGSITSYEAMEDCDYSPSSTVMCNKIYVFYHYNGTIRCAYKGTSGGWTTLRVRSFSAPSKFTAGTYEDKGTVYINFKNPSDGDYWCLSWTAASLHDHYAQDWLDGGCSGAPSKFAQNNKVYYCCGSLTSWDMYSALIDLP